MVTLPLASIEEVYAVGVWWSKKGSVEESGVSGRFDASRDLVRSNEEN